jgi:antitoxin component YwqK of YwqJK toxin-antitoxin module
MKYSGNWKEGKEDGIWKVFDASGNFKGKIRYERGKIIE